MTDQPRRPRFSIRKLSPEEAELQDRNREAQRQAAAQPTPTAPTAAARRRPQPPTLPRTPQRAKSPPAPAPEPPAVQPVAVASELTAGLFENAGSVLSFLGAAFSLGLADSASLQRGPQNQCWTQLELPWRRIAQVMQSAGGRAFAHADGRWRHILPTGEISQGSGTAPDVSHWPQVEPASLLHATSVQPGRAIASPSVDVIVPGTLARWVLEQAAAVGMHVMLVPVERHSLLGDGEPSPAMRLRIRAAHGEVPTSLVRCLTALPYSLVANSPDEPARRLLVDVRIQLPCPSQLLAELVPENEIWAVGPDDVGRWRLQTVGGEIDGAALLTAPAPNFVPIPQSGPTRLPQPLPVRLVVARCGPRRTDAVLLDDAELDWLRRYLTTRPAGELAFLIPGEGSHLLTAPGGLPSEVPFGTPLIHLQPGGLYVEQGLEFSPPLPEAARQVCFQLDAQSVVAVKQSGAYRFRLADLVPAWSLWVGELPPFELDLNPDRNPEALRTLNSIAALYRQPDLVAAKKQADSRPASIAIRPVERRDQARVLAEAQRLELSGHLIRAAELLESAGYPGPAGRLYERAAS